MRKRASITVSTFVALSLALGVSFVPSTAQAQMIDKTATAGVYSVTLKVMPAESFSGTHPEMVRDAGAKPNMLNGPVHPNRHIVAFVKENGKPVENAKVVMKYRELSPSNGKWVRVPVVRMHMGGKGLETTHYGNNLKLDAGSYEVSVTVNGSKAAIFQFSLT